MIGLAIHQCAVVADWRDHHLRGQMTSKYQRWHDSIIERSKDRQSKTATEKHHIIPRCLGGGNEQKNIVRLSYREHYLIHWLLTKITHGNDRRKMLHALFNMGGVSPRFNDRAISSWQYERSRFANIEATKLALADPKIRAKIFTKERSEKISLARMGIPPTITSERNAKIAAALTGRKRQFSPEHCANMRIPGKGKGSKRASFSVEHRANLSKAMKGRGKGLKRKPFTAEHRANISRAKMGQGKGKKRPARAQDWCLAISRGKKLAFAKSKESSP